MLISDLEVGDIIKINHYAIYSDKPCNEILTINEITPYSSITKGVDLVRITFKDHIGSYYFENDEIFTGSVKVMELK